MAENLSSAPCNYLWVRLTETLYFQHVTSKGTLDVTTQEDLWTLPGSEAIVFTHIPLAGTQSFGHIETVGQLSTQGEKRNGSATASLYISTAKNRTFKIILI